MNLKSSSSLFKSDKIKKCFLFVYIAIVLFITGIMICNLSINEINHNYTPDSPMYCAVARGILNGISPYSCLYENKPIGVFLLYALSFLLTDDVIIFNCITFLCLLIIGFLPFVCTTKYLIKSNKPFSRSQIVIYSGISLIWGLFLTSYSMDRGEFFQTEILGASFICLYFWAIMHINWKKGEKANKKSLIIWTILAAIFAMCGVMMKEPFAVIAVAGGLLLVESVRDFISRIVIPLCIGAVMAVFMLLFTGIMSDYINIYIYYMFNGHISRLGSPFKRALQIHNLFVDLSIHNPILLLIIFSFTLLIILKIYKSKDKNIKSCIWQLCSLVICIFLTSFCVGLGGQYFPHHYVFATPIYMLLIIKGCEILSELCRGKEAQISIFTIIMVTIVFLNEVSLFKKPLLKSSKSLATYHTSFYYQATFDAEYVDALLDYYHENTYQYLGFNGRNSFYAFTKHSPKGPVFVQDSYNFEDENSWFSQNLLKQLDEVNIIFMKNLDMPAINDKVKKILDTEFTTEPKDKFTEMRPCDGFEVYTVYYRIGTH